jgi:hypothetical protein
MPQPPPDELGIAAGDLEDINETAEAILRHQDRIYIITHQLHGIEAIEWMDAYEKSMNGDIDSVILMMQFLHQFAERLDEMMEVDDADIEGWNSENTDGD